MPAQSLTVGSIHEVVQRIIASRQITRLDQQCLLLCHSPNSEDQTLINQVFDRLKRGLVKVVD